MHVESGNPIEHGAVGIGGATSDAARVKAQAPNLGATKLTHDSLGDHALGVEHSALQSAQTLKSALRKLPDEGARAEVFDAVTAHQKHLLAFAQAHRATDPASAADLIHSMKSSVTDAAKAAAFRVQAQSQSAHLAPEERIRLEDIDDQLHGLRKNLEHSYDSLGKALHIEARSAPIMLVNRRSFWGSPGVVAAMASAATIFILGMIGLLKQAAQPRKPSVVVVRNPQPPPQQMRFVPAQPQPQAASQAPEPGATQKNPSTVVIVLPGVAQQTKSSQN